MTGHARVEPRAYYSELTALAGVVYKPDQAWMQIVIWREMYLTFAGPT